jgi:hypothetical protein
MRHISSIVTAILAVAALAAAPGARADETDCGNLNLSVDLEGYLPTWCYREVFSSSEARAEWEIMVVEGASSYAMVVAAHAFAFTYLPRQTTHSLIEELLDESEKVNWKGSVDHSGYTVQRFTTVESSGRETNCVAFNRNSPAQNGRPKHRLYGYLCLAGRGELEESSIVTFIDSVDD